MMNDAFLASGDLELILAAALLLGGLVWQFGGRVSRALKAECFSDRERATVGYCMIMGGVLVSGFVAQRWAQWAYDQLVLWRPE